LNLHRERIYGERRKILEAEPSQLREKFLNIIQNYGFKKEDFEKKEAEIGKERILEIGRYLYLRILDTLWINHLENMEHLRDSVSLRAYGQREPLVEYKREGNRIFRDFFENLNLNFSKMIMGLKIIEKEEIPAKTQTFSKKPGRNDPCPCGSGKKYKKCCWPKYGY